MLGRGNNLFRGQECKDGGIDACLDRDQCGALDEGCHYGLSELRLVLTIIFRNDFDDLEDVLFEVVSAIITNFANLAYQVAIPAA